MGLFDGMLRDDESLFMNEIALDFDFMPKNIKCRDGEQEQIAQCIKPLFKKRNGTHVILYGPPGIGKTLAVKKVLEEVEETSQEIMPLYINCWEYNTTYKIVLRMCELLDYKFVVNKHTNELMDEIVRILNKESAVFVFDEIDKVNDMDFLYTILGNVYRKSIILITNYIKDLMNFDDRIKSRLTPDTVEFRPYNAAETEGILRERVNLAFVRGVWDEDAFEKIVDQTVMEKDVRKGLALLREAGNCAETDAKRSIHRDHAILSIQRLSSFHSNESRLTEDQKVILGCAKGKTQKMGDLFSAYQKSGGVSSYKTFQRRIDELEKQQLITTSKTKGGKDGNTTMVSYNKSLKDFT